MVLQENDLRARVTADVAAKGGEFDVVTIGNYEVPIWAEQGKLLPLPTLPESYDLDDLLKPVRKALAYRGLLYALPFYGESAMTFYRTDLFAHAGLTMPAAPTYDDIRTFADKLTDRAHGVYGICLRGKPGWGQNVAIVTSMVNAFGGQWFDADWRPTLDTPAWQHALGYYHDILAARRSAGCRGSRLQQDPEAVQRRSLRHADRRDGGGRRPLQQGAFAGGRKRQLRADADRQRRHCPDLAMELEPRHTGRHAQEECRDRLPDLGDVEGVRLARGQDRRLGLGAARHPPINL